MCAYVEYVEKVHSLWAAVTADPKYYGEITLQRSMERIVFCSPYILSLFETHPDVQKLFPKFADLSKEQMQNNPDLQAYGENVICKLTKFVQKELEDESLVNGLGTSCAEQNRIFWIKFWISEIIVMVAAEKSRGCGTDILTALKNVLKKFESDI